MAGKLDKYKEWLKETYKEDENLHFLWVSKVSTTIYIKENSLILIHENSFSSVCKIDFMTCIIKEENPMLKCSIDPSFYNKNREIQM